MVNPWKCEMAGNVAQCLEPQIQGQKSHLCDLTFYDLGQLT